MDDRYGTTCSRRLAHSRTPRRARVEATADAVVEVAADGFCGAVVGVASGLVELEDRHGRRRLFPLGPGFLVDGADVVPTRRHRPPRGGAAADGIRLFAAPETRAGRPCEPHPGRGRHDAELVEKVWGDDLRAEGVVVEYLQGIDLLEAALDAEPPSPERRWACWWITSWRGPRSPGSPTRSHAGRTAATCASSATRTSTCGSASRPARWASRGGRRCRAAPTSRRERAGARLAVRDARRSGACLQRILGRVHSYRDLDPALLGRVEELIDFVSA